MKITEKTYYLPYIEALQPCEVLDDSANKPQIIRGVDRITGIKGDYVVKYTNFGRLSIEAAMRELLAAFIAMEWKIPVTMPAIINISNDFANLLKGQSHYLAASNSVGLNYGSQYIINPIIFNPERNLMPSQFVQAADILLFDIFIQTSDRTKIKPNIMTVDDEIIIFDHEISFGFTMDIIPNPAPWYFRENDIHWINNHILKNKIDCDYLDFEKFSLNLETLNSAFWAKAESLIPQTWLSPQFFKIKDYSRKILLTKTITLQILKIFSYEKF